MSLSDDLRQSVRNTFKNNWERTNGTVIPETTDIGLGNKAKDIEIAILYADITNSTELVNGYKDWFSGEIYKNFLYCCSKIIRDNDGEIRSFDGDRIMGIFIGSAKNSKAAKTALKINWCVKNIIQKEHDEHYKDRSNYKLKHTCAIDRTKVMATRTGIRGNNDLVWIGRAANYAADLNSFATNGPSRITSDVYNMLNDEAKYSNGTNMWTRVRWEKRNMDVYTSTYWWKF